LVSYSFIVVLHWHPPPIRTHLSNGFSPWLGWPPLEYHCSLSFFLRFLERHSQHVKIHSPSQTTPPRAPILPMNQRSFVTLELPEPETSIQFERDIFFYPELSESKSLSYIKNLVQNYCKYLLSTSFYITSYNSFLPSPGNYHTFVYWQRFNTRQKNKHHCLNNLIFFFNCINENALPDQLSISRKNNVYSLK